MHQKPDRKKKASAARRSTRQPVTKKKGAPISARNAQRKTVKIRAAKKKPANKKPILEGKVIGTVTHYFPHVSAAAIKVVSPFKPGITVRIKGHTTDLSQVIESMQLDRVNIKEARKNQEIGILVTGRVRRRDKVLAI
jgi:hypothetical protein